MPPITIILADDHSIFRQGLRALLDKQSSLEVIGEAGNGREAIALVEELSPQVIVMDVGMPDLNGIEATRRIVGKFPKTKVIGLSMHNDKHFVKQMLQAGASGYLLKESIFEELVQAIEAVVNKKGFLSPKIARLVIEDYTGGKTEEDPGMASLSKREREILQLLAEGKTSKQIADELFLSPKTVENHRKRVMQKLDIHNVAELTKFAIRHGLTFLE
jgi:two-component system, NarL family, response regulator NreC